MKVLFRYGVLPVAVFLLLALVTVVLAPVLVNVQRFVPSLEKELSQATGRRVSLGHDLSLSFFPWLSLSFSELQVGNPPGFSTDNFLQIRSFEARVKVLPLLRNRVEISRFVVGGLSLNLEKRADGLGNWQGLLGEPRSSASASKPGALPGVLSRLSFSLLAVTDGQVRWRDATRHEEQRIADIMLLLNDFTPHKAVAVDAKAVVNGKALALEGKVGPLLAGPQGKIALDLGLLVFNTLKGRFQGSLTPGKDLPGLSGNYEIPGFSLRELAAAGGVLPAPQGENDKALHQLSLKGALAVDNRGLRLENGSGALDDTQLRYTLALARGEGSGEFTLDLDRLDLGRYLPLLGNLTANHQQGAKEGMPGLLGALPNGVITIGRLDHGRFSLDELHLPLAVLDGGFRINGLKGNLAGGTVSGDISWQPGQAAAHLSLNRIDGATLSRQWLEQDGLKATFDADLELSWELPMPASGLERLAGEGVVTLGEGMIIGSDLTKPLPASAAGAGEGEGDPPATSFTAGRAPFRLAGGVAQLGDAVLTLANGELAVNGAIDLLQQRLELETAATTTATVTGKRGREEQVTSTIFHSITGPIAGPEVADRHDLAIRADSRQSATQLVAEKLPAPTGEGLGNLVGKDLVDPAVVAERFRLQPELLRAGELKMKLPLGTGRVLVRELRQEERPR